MFGYLWFRTIFHLSWNTFYLELAEYACTQSIFATLALDYENSEDLSEDNEDQFYEEPDLSGGIEGVDYGIVYGTSDEEPDVEA